MGTTSDPAAARLRGSELDAAPTQRIFEGICEQVRTELTFGHLKPGDKLPAERDLALRLGSSRTAVREALRSLEMAGVVELRKGVKGGAFIREGDPGVVTRSFGDMVHLGRISLGDLTEGRVIIQDAVVRLACVRASEADFEALELSIDRTEALTRSRRPAERRLQLVNFYRLLAQATRNEVLVILVDALTDIVLTVLARNGAAPKEDTVRVHREIVRLLRRRDADAAAALMARHLETLHGHLFAAAVKGGRAGAAKGRARQRVSEPRASSGPRRTTRSARRPRPRRRSRRNGRCRRACARRA
jgi:DNA-binding FadR family transcriptional regulator